MANKKKPLKKQKIRNSEYYDMQFVLDELYAASVKGQRFCNLVELIKRPENIKLAYRNIRKNSGSRTAGVDNKTISDLNKWNENALVAHVQRKLDWYIPNAVRRVEIPKDNGKTRPLGIPTIMDRLIQQCILQVLEPICEAKFFKRSNGFRPNHSAENAIAQAERMIQNVGCHYVIDIDIKSFFDNVNHGKLLKQMWTLGIRDKKLLSIISAMLKAEVAGIGFPEKGTPQGGIISPLLSNIVLNELDWWIVSQWEEMPTQRNYVHRIYANGTPDKSSTIRTLRNYTNLKECYVVRYADDFKIFCKKRSDAIKLFEATKQWLLDRLGLKISPEKSKIVNLKRHYSEFLGFKLKVRTKGKKPDGQPRYVVEAHIKDKALQKIREKNNVPVLMLTAKSDEEDKVSGLRLGADDYITKPFSMEELTFRIEAILRRVRGKKNKESNIYKIGKFTFDTQKQILATEGKQTKLTTKESELLGLLCAHANEILQRDFALKTIWIDDNYFNARSMDVYITKLRKHLKEDDSIEIINIHGKGYKLITPEVES